VMASFPELRNFGTADALLEAVRTELGAEDALDETFTGSVRAVAPQKLLHIISANTPMAGIQSLARGLVLGGHNWCKIPSAGLPRFVEFVEALPESLRAKVDVSATMLPSWLEQADAVVVFGTDETVEKFRRTVHSDQIFAGYGARWSGAVIFSDAEACIEPLVRDIGLYDQMGCLSAQIVWLHESIDAKAFGRQLASALERFSESAESLNVEDAASVACWRAAAEWKAIEDERNRVWLSRQGPVWGVALSRDEQPSLSCLHRHVSVCRFSEVPPLGNLSASVSTLGVWPWRPENVARLDATGASRICAVGEMQFPPATWRQDGFPALGRLVRFQGIG
ncbi:MAG TPA: acyl-CoA reductase, partial [Chthoniobacterales bacterium]